jgi:2-methylcitrate dehydratase PrpD
MTAAPALTGERKPVADGFSRDVAAAYQGWDFASLPEDVVARIKLFVLDTLGVIAAASDAAGIQELNATLRGWEKDGASTALIGKWRASPPNAALANGAAAHALDFDDNHDPGRVHAYSVILPAALAAAEQKGGVSGREFITALATGVELQARLGLASPNSMPRGWHPTTVMGAFGAAAAAARILKLEGGKFSDALGLAYHQASGTRQALNDGVLAKRLGPGFSARNGVTAAFFAAAGLTGPTRFLEGEAGHFGLYERGEVVPGRLLDGLGRDWEVLTHSMKPYPCCRCTHNAIAIGEALHREGLKAGQIDRVVIGMGRTNTKIVGDPYEAKRNSTVHAQFNAGYCFAAALVHGKVNLATFQAPNLTDPVIAELAGRARVVVDDLIPAAAMSPTRITVTKRDGTSFVQYREFMDGSPEQPMSEAEAIAKFAACMETGTGASRPAIDKLAEKVLSLERCSDIAEVVSLFPEADRNQA